MRSLAVEISCRRGPFTLAIDHSFPLAGITALFGRSGSGKTSVLRIIAGLERSATARVVCGDSPWQDETTWVAPHRRNIGFVFQDTRLFPHMSVADNLAFPLRRSTRRSTMSLDDIVSAFDLADLVDRAPSSLSGGEAQRVAIGRALLSDARLLLMDEPLSSLDRQSKDEILPFIEMLPGRFDTSIIYVTHDIDEVVRLADRIVLLERGRIAAAGSVAEILENVALWPLLGMRDAGSVLEVRFAGTANGTTRLAVGEQMLCVPGDVQSLGAHSRIRILARDVVLATRPVTNVSIRNMLECTLLTVDTNLSPYAEVLLDVEGQRLRARITRDAAIDLGLRPNMPVFALIKSVAFDRRP